MKNRNLVSLFTALHVMQVESSIPFSCNVAGDIAFTFDEGPSYYTGILLNTLKKYNTKAAFHVTTDYLDNPAIMAYLRSAAKDGHIIGLFAKQNVTAETVADYLRATSSKLEKYTGQKIQFVRFPVPGPDERVLSKAAELGFIVTSYNLDSQDYSYTASVPGWEPIFENFKRSLDSIVEPAKGSFIVVQRDSLQASVNQTDSILSYTKKKGYNPVRLDQCIGRSVQNSGTSDGPLAAPKPDTPDADPSKPATSGEESLSIATRLAALAIILFLSCWRM